MTDDELSQLNNLYEEKIEIQDTLAKKMTDADGTMQKNMELMMQNAAKKAEKMKEIGEQTGQGFLEGLQSKSESIIASGISIAGGLVDSVRNKLGIHSPSTVMAELGEYTGQGYENGAVRSFQEANEQIEKELAKLSDVDTVGPTLDVTSRFGASNEQYGMAGLSQVVELLGVIANKSDKLYLNTGELVGGIINEVDSSLGDLQATKAMGALR
jgi:hypothetical protein